MYSQNNEEQIIAQYFSGKVGRFLDIGAFNPFKFSNTRKLYEMGWSGVYVEPSPICFGAFEREYTNDNRIVLINKAVVTDNSTTIQFFEANGDAVSTSNIGHKDKWQKAGAKFNEVSVEAINVQNLLEQFPDINFLNIDIEGMNYDLFMSIPNSYLQKLDMLCIEHDNWHQVIENTMFGLGFKKLLFNGENIIFGK